METEPVEDVRKTEFMLSQVAVNELVSVFSSNINVEAVATKEHVSRGEGDSNVVIDEPIGEV